MRDGRGAPFLIQGYVAALRAKGGLHGIGQSVNAYLQIASCFFAKTDLLCHIALSPRFLFDLRAVNR